MRFSQSRGSCNQHCEDDERGLAKQHDYGQALRDLPREGERHEGETGGQHTGSGKDDVRPGRAVHDAPVFIALHGVPHPDPGEVVARLSAGMVAVVNTPEMKTILSNQGLEPLTHTPQQFGAFIQGEIVENAKLIKVIGLKAE